MGGKEVATGRVAGTAQIGTEYPLTIRGEITWEVDTLAFLEVRDGI